MAKESSLSLSPSQMDRVEACPGSAALSATMPRRQSSFAAEGNAAHELAQMALTDGKFDASLYRDQLLTIVDKKGTPFETTTKVIVTPEMCEKVQVYIDSVKERCDAFRAQENVKKVTLYIEEKIDVSDVLGVPKKNGMADTLIVVEYNDGTGMISVEDLKYGKGIRVDAKDNTQLMIYGAGALDQQGKDLDIKEVNLVIHQPRQNHFSEHTVTAKQLRDLSKKLKNAVQLAIAQQQMLEEKGVEALTLKAGKQCTFCDAKSICPAFKAVAAMNKKPANDNGRKKPAQKKPRA